MTDAIVPPEAVVQVATVPPRATWGQYIAQHPVARWTNQDVQDWLESVQLQHLGPAFIKLNGASLLSLTDRSVDEILSTNNSAIKELGSTFQIADKVNFKMHFELLRADSPVIYKCYNFFTSTFFQVPLKVQTELVNKISSKTVEVFLKYVALGISAFATTYIAATWMKSPKSKKKS